MGIPFTLPMGFLFTVTMGILLTIGLGIQLTISIILPLEISRLLDTGRRGPSSAYYTKSVYSSLDMSRKAQNVIWAISNI
jgi:hypothetical protein